MLQEIDQTKTDNVFIVKKYINAVDLHLKKIQMYLVCAVGQVLFT